MNKEKKEKLNEIIAIVLNLREDENPESARKLTDERWDSLAQVNMIAAIENEYNVEINPADYGRFTSYKAIMNLLDEILA